MVSLCVWFGVSFLSLSLSLPLSLSLSRSFSLSLPLLTLPPSSPGAWYPNHHGLCRGPPPLGGVPGAPAAIRGLEESVGHQSDQHGGIPPPQTCSPPTRLHTQGHQRKTRTQTHTYRDTHRETRTETHTHKDTHRDTETHTYRDTHRDTHRDAHRVVSK